MFNNLEWGNKLTIFSIIQYIIMAVIIITAQRYFNEKNGYSKKDYTLNAILTACLLAFTPILINLNASIAVVFVFNVLSTLYILITNLKRKSFIIVSSSIVLSLMAMTLLNYTNVYSLIMFNMGVMLFSILIELELPRLLKKSNRWKKTWNSPRH